MGLARGIWQDAHRKLTQEDSGLSTLPLPDLSAFLPTINTKAVTTSLRQDPGESTPASADQSDAQQDTKAEEADDSSGEAEGSESTSTSDFATKDPESSEGENGAAAPIQSEDEVQVEVMAGAPGPEEYVIYEGDLAAPSFADAAAPIEFVEEADPEEAAASLAEVMEEAAAPMAEDGQDIPASAPLDEQMAEEHEGQEDASVSGVRASQGVNFLRKNASHTLGAGSKVLPEITLTKEYDGSSYNFSDHAFEKPDLPAKPKFTVTKIEHIIKPQKPEKSQKKIHITEKKWRDTVRPHLHLIVPTWLQQKAYVYFEYQPCLMHLQEVIDKVVKKPPLNVNITIIKDKGKKIKPYIIKPELNISVIKFKHEKLTNYAYKPEVHHPCWIPCNRCMISNIQADSV